MAVCGGQACLPVDEKASRGRDNPQSAAPKRLAECNAARPPAASRSSPSVHACIRRQAHRGPCLWQEFMCANGHSLGLTITTFPCWGSPMWWSSGTANTMANNFTGPIVDCLRGPSDCRLSGWNARRPYLTWWGLRFGSSSNKWRGREAHAP